MLFEHEFVKISNGRGLVVTLSKTGAGIYSIKLNGIEMVSSPKKRKAYLTSYYGKIVGPYAGRRLVDGKVELHSASRCTGFRKFEVELNDKKRPSKAVFTLKDENLVVTYEASKDSDTLEMTIDCNGKGFIGYVNHAYYNLGGLPDAKKHVIRMQCSRTSRLEDNLLMFEPIPVVPELDFREGLEAGKYLDAPILNRPGIAGYDHRFIFDEGAEKVMYVESIVAKMTVKTECDAIQMYSSCWPDPKMKMTTGYYDCQCSCLAIEPSFVPGQEKDFKDDEPNHYVRKTSYSFELKGAK